MAARDAAVELGAQRPVAVPGVARVLDELAGPHALLEFVLGEEVVRDALHLPRPGSPRRGRDGELERGDALQQRPDQGALADPGGAGDHEDPRH